MDETNKNLLSNSTNSGQMELNQNQNSGKSRMYKDSQFEPCMVGCPYTERWKDPKDQKDLSKTARCYVDRTTQLLTSIAIAISDIVRQKHTRMQAHEKKEMKEQMFKFE